MNRIRDISIDDFSKLKDLISQSSTTTFFQTPDWIQIWDRHFQTRKHYLGVFENDEIIGIAPIAEIGETLELIPVSKVYGKERLSDYGDLIIKTGYEKTVWDAVINELRNRYPKKPFILDFIREDSPSFAILQEMGGQSKQTDTAPFLSLPGDCDTYLSALDRKDRHELRRKLRRLEEAGAFKVCYEGEPSDVEEFFRLMSLSAVEKEHFLTSQIKEFFKDILNHYWEKKMLELCFLKIEGKNIAVAMGFKYRNEFLLYNSGYDPAYNTLAPGLLMVAFTIKHSIEEKMKRYDFLRGNERYKYDLGGTDLRLYQYTLNLL